MKQNKKITDKKDLTITQWIFTKGPVGRVLHEGGDGCLLGTVGSVDLPQI